MPGAELLDATLAAAAVTVAVGGLVRGLAGFGAALVMAPILSLLYGPASAVGVVTALELAGFLQLLPGSARHIRWQEIAPMGATALLALPVGVYLLLHVEPELMRRAIGGIVLALAVLLLLGVRASRRPGLAGALGVSAVAGMLEGLAGTPGPPVVLYLYSGPDSAATNRHQLIGFFSLLDAAAVLLFATQGVYSAGNLERTLLLLPVSVAGTWLGGRLFHRMAESHLRRLALGLILLIGLVGLLY